MGILSTVDIFTSFTGGTLGRTLSHALAPTHPDIQINARHTDELAAGTAPALIWVTAEAASFTYSQCCNGHPVDMDAALADINLLAARIIEASASRPLTLVASLVPALDRRPGGPSSFDPENGEAYLLTRMNLALADALAAIPQTSAIIRMLDASHWLRAAQPQAYAAKQWYVAKIPFAPSVFQLTAAEVSASLFALEGRARKILITDLDDTLWGGVVGDDGIEGLHLGGHDHIGEIHADIQKTLKSLTRRGIQLAIASKNDEETALNAIDTHPEMHLSRNDFAGWAINWADKAENIRTLMNDLRLGLDSAVFLDDNPVERDRVRTTLPEILVPELPADKSQWPALIQGLTCFDQTTLSNEDRTRTQAYAAERRRVEARSGTTSQEEWVTSLDIHVAAQPLAPLDIQRAVQLFNKTNQMNLSTRRFTQSQLEHWAQDVNREFWTIRVRDRFADAGLTALLGLEHDGTTTHIVDFIMSCRVIGRMVENTVLAIAAQRAAARGTKTLSATLIPTDRNTPCATFFKDHSGFIETAQNIFSWEVAMGYPSPAAITLEMSELTGNTPAPSAEIAQ